MVQQKRLLLFRAAALFVACAAAWPLLSEPGLLNTRGGGDSPFLLQRVQQLVTALGDGHFPVRWMPDAAYGYGYPFFNYYAPLSLYIAALFRFLGFTYVGAIKLAQLIGFLVAAWGMFTLGRRWLRNDWAGLLAAAAYTLAPFHMVNVYVRGDSLAEFWAMAFYPLVLLAAARVVEQPEIHSMLWLALAYAALALTHNISALIFSPFLLLYVVLAIWRLSGGGELRRRVALLAGSGIVLGLALSAWFWLPALAESDLVQTAPVTEGYFSYAVHFLEAPVQDSLPFDYDVAGRGAFRMGLLQALLALAGVVTLVVLRWRRRLPVALSSPAVLFVCVTLLISTIMLTRLSRPVWDTLPLLPYSQFPWRFLSVQALATALLAGTLAWWPQPRLVVPTTVVMLLVSALATLHPDHLPLPDALVTGGDLAAYEWFTGNIGSTVSAEYLPAGVVPRPFASEWLNDGVRDTPRFLDGRGAITEIVRRSHVQEWEVTVADGPGTVLFPTLFWPGWQAELDGLEANLHAANGSGLMVLEQLPEGVHRVELFLGRTPVRTAGETVALFALLLLTALGLSVLSKGGGTQVARLLLVGFGLLLLLAAGARLWPEPVVRADTLTWDFAQLGYLHPAPAGIPFSDGSRLAAYTYVSDVVSPGEQLLVMLVWDAGDAAGQPVVSLELVTPAVHRFPDAPILSGASNLREQGETTLALAIPDDAPLGLYVPRLSLAGRVALTPAGFERGDLFLRPVRLVASQAAAADPASDTLLDVRVSGVSLEEPTVRPVSGKEWQPAPPACDGEAGLAVVRLGWWTALPLSNNYAVSLRLTDTIGRDLVLCDSQPGYGFRPSTGWPVGQVVNDWLSLPLPSELPEEEPLFLTVRLYDVASGHTVLVRRLGQLLWETGELRYAAWRPGFDLPGDVTQTEVEFGESIALDGYRLMQADEVLDLTLYWRAIDQSRRDYQRFVHVLDAETGEIAAQLDGVPQGRTYPTGQWAVGEVVADPVSLDLASLPPGQYRIAVGLYLPDPTLTRLVASGADRASLADDRFLLTPLFQRP